MLAKAKRDVKGVEGIYDDYKFTVFNFIGAGRVVGDGGPQAYMAELPPGKGLESHFHPVDQFQVFFGADGAYFERNPIDGLFVQYSDAYTPYGPFRAGATPLSFFTLRAKATSEHHTMPGARDKMLRPRGRSVKTAVKIGDSAVDFVETETIIEPASDRMAAFLIRVAPGKEVDAPSPAGTGGQYFVVLRGFLECDAGTLPYQSCVFVSAAEAPLQLAAPRLEELAVLVLQFPRPK